MTTRRIRDLQRDLSTVAEPFGAKLVGIRLANSGHLHATIACGAKIFVVYAGLTPSKPSTKKEASFVKRKLRELTTGRQSMRVLVNSHGSTLRFWTRLPLRLKCFATQGISRPRIFDAAQVVASEPFQTNTTNMFSTMSRITSTWLKDQTAFICAGVAMVLRSLIAVPIERADVAKLEVPA